MDKIGQLTGAMIAYYAGDPRRINHFLKVFSFSKAIGELEGLEANTQTVLEMAALTHDIGIKNSERKYQSSAGKYQELEGPPEARAMLEGLAVPPAAVDRVCWLIAHHHTYGENRELDHQILVEADFLVNAFEDGLSAETIRHVRDKLFRTDSGRTFLDSIYG